VIAVISVETGIAPNDLLDADPDVLRSMVGYLHERAEDEKEQADRERLRRELGK
jgi:hypothetical protein